jgi:hypothetical protein
MNLPLGLSRQAATAILGLAMVAVIVGVDVLVFRSRTWFWERLATNIGLVLLFGAVYFRFLRRA